MSDWNSDVLEPVNDANPLNAAQVRRLMAMTVVLQDRVNLSQVAEIKQSILDDDHDSARALFDDFTEAEQTALWVAPSYGGVFTTLERKVIKNL